MMNKKGLGSDHKTTWLTTCNGCVVESANYTRGYVQNRLKESFIKFAAEHKKLPTVESLIQCAMRTIDLSKPDNLVLFDFYVTDLLCTQMPLWSTFCINMPTMSTHTACIFCQHSIVI
jgi:hypothetical protein